MTCNVVLDGGDGCRVIGEDRVGGKTIECGMAVARVDAGMVGWWWRHGSLRTMRVHCGMTVSGMD